MGKNNILNRINSVILLTVMSLTALPMKPQDCDSSAVKHDIAPVSVGLVLSGGGAKGIAEIGVIKALEENNIPIDYVAGTSMGAIVGGLYAAGYTPDEMIELILSPGFADWSTGQINPSLRYYFGSRIARPEIVSVSLKLKSDTATSVLPSSLISPLPMNFAFMELFAAYTAQSGGDFNRLMIPFRCVTSDVYAKHKVVLSKGDFGDAIRASMSFPTVFQPIEIDGFLAFDGGIYDNFPVDVMRKDFAPGIIIGVDVSEPNGKTPQYDIMQQLEDLIMQDSNYEVPPAEGIRIRIPPEGTTLLDFPKARVISQRGYDKAMEMMDSIKSRVASRIPAEARELKREVFKSKTPYVRFDSVHVEGGTSKQNEFIKYLFTGNRADTFGLEHAKLAYYRAVTSGKLRNLVPHAVYNDSTGYFTLDMKATVKDNMNVGVGTYLTSSVNSMIVLSAGYNSLALRSLDLDFNSWLGQSYIAAAVNSKMYLPTAVPSAVTFSAVVSHHSEHQGDELFYERDNPVFMRHFETFGRVGYSWALGRTGEMDVTAGYGYLRDKYATTGESLTVESGKDVINFSLGQATVRLHSNTLDNEMYPTGGHRYKLSGMAMLGDYTLRSATDPGKNIRNREYKWLQAELNIEKYFAMGRHFSLGLETNVLASTRKLLDSYNASLVTAPAFNPTASSYNSFHSSLRAMSYATAGIIPVVKISDNLQVRCEAHMFMPFRAIERNPEGCASYGGWFRDPKFLGEFSVAYNFPFKASLSGYVNYTDSSGDRWNVGLSFGLFFLAPQFLR